MLFKGCWSEILKIGKSVGGWHFFSLKKVVLLKAGDKIKSVEVFAFKGDCLTAYTSGGGIVANNSKNMYHKKDSKYM